MIYTYSFRFFMIVQQIYGSIEVPQALIFTKEYVFFTFQRIY